MRIITWDYVPISSMLLPGNWRSLVNGDPEVSKYAVSISKVGIIHEPVVRGSDKRLICGRRRVAAKAKLGEKEVLCKIIECTDQEALLLERVENAEREHFTPEKHRENINVMLDLLVAAEANKEGIVPLGKGGRGRGARSQAIAKVALERGVQPDSIRIQAWRHKRAAVTAEKKAKGELPPDSLPTYARMPPAITDPPPIAELGMSVGVEFISQMVKLQHFIDGAARAMSKASGILTTLAREDLPLHDDRIAKVHDQVQEAAAALRGLRPTMLCPYCKGLGNVTAACVPCNRTAYITKVQEANVPPELLRTDNPLVFFGGKYLEAADVVEEQMAEPVAEEAPEGDDFWQL